MTPAPTTEATISESEKLVKRLEAAVSLGEKVGARGKSPSSIYNIAAEAASLITQQAAEIAAMVAELGDMKGWPSPAAKLKAVLDAVASNEEASEALAASQSKRIAQLEGALAKFADFQNCQAADVVHAREVLSTPPIGGGETDARAHNPSQGEE